MNFENASCILHTNVQTGDAVAMFPMAFGDISRSQNECLGFTWVKEGGEFYADEPFAWYTDLLSVWRQISPSSPSYAVRCKQSQVDWIFLGCGFNDSSCSTHLEERGSKSSHCFLQLDRYNTCCFLVPKLAYVALHGKDRKRAHCVRFWSLKWLRKVATSDQINGPSLDRSRVPTRSAIGFTGDWSTMCHLVA